MKNKRALLISVLFLIGSNLCQAANSSEDLLPEGQIVFTIGDYLPSHRNDLYALVDSGKRLKQLTDNHILDDFAQCSPTSSEIVYISAAEDKWDWDVWTLNLRHIRPKVVQNNKGRDLTPTWTHQGNIAWSADFTPDWIKWFKTTEEKNYELVVKAPQDTLFQRLTFNHTWEETPTWHRQGEWILYTSTTSPSSDPGNIYRMKTDGTQAQPFIELPGLQKNAKWSPDGQWVIFESSDSVGFEQQSDVYLADSIGGSITNLTQGIGLNGYPSWAGNSQWILFHSNRNGNYDIFRMRRDGSEIVQVTHSSLNEFRPTWCRY